MIISGNDAAGTKDLKCHLTQTFKMKDLGPLTYFLGLEISRSKCGMCIHQRKYVEDLLVSVCFFECRSVDEPLKLMCEFDRMTATPYLILPCIAGLWVAYYISTWQDRISLSHPNCQLVCRQPSPYFDMFRVLFDSGLFYSSNTALQLRAYADADSAGGLDTSHDLKSGPMNFVCDWFVSHSHHKSN